VEHLMHEIVHGFLDNQDERPGSPSDSTNTNPFEASLLRFRNALAWCYVAHCEKISISVILSGHRADVP
jgi:hypothetical protein